LFVTVFSEENLLENNGVLL